MTILRKCFC